MSRKNPRFAQRLEELLSDARTVAIAVAFFALEMYALYEFVRNHIR